MREVPGRVKRAAPRAILFDLDGTLVDSAPDLSRALDHALDKHGLAPLGEPTVRGFIGGGAARLVHRALTGVMDGDAPRAQFEPVFETFLAAYTDGICVESRLYPGVRELLPRLAGEFRLAIVTNKPARFVAPLLEALDITTCFELVVAGDTLPRKKPDPLPVRHAVQRLGARPDRCWMVGDSVVDFQASRAAGVHPVCVSYGYSRDADLRAHGVRRIIDNFAALETVVPLTHGRPAAVR